jgi:predicted O-methyltransferase YrrM
MIEIQGWLDPEVAAAMRNLILKTRPDICVEIGVYAGKSLINSALALKENGSGVIYGIDPWRNKDAYAALSPNDNEELWRTLDLDGVHTACMHAIWEHELEDQTIIIRTTSRMARAVFEPQSIDVLYIDGGHSEAASSSDAELYLPKVRHRGHIWVDDTNWPSLQKAVSILREQCVLVKDFGCCHLYKKL